MTTEDRTRNRPSEFTNTKESLRLDLFLVQTLENCTRRLAAALCDDGFVLVNGAKRRAGFLLRPGDLVRVERQLRVIQARPEVASRPGSLADTLQVRYEDEDLVIVEKPRAMHSVRLKEEEGLTVADFVANHCKQCLTASPDKREAGLVQRLDYFTSGVMIAAKTAQAWQALHGLMLDGGVKKSYMALVEGRVRKGRFTIREPLIQAPSGKKMLVKSSRGETLRGDLFVTHVERLRAGELIKGSDVSAVALTGSRFRRHQIRAHMEWEGHSLVGDELYGSELQLDDVLPEELLEGVLSKGFFLHAESVEFTQPFSKSKVVVRSTSQYFDRLLSRMK